MGRPLANYAPVTALAPDTQTSQELGKEYDIPDTEQDLERRLNITWRLDQLHFDSYRPASPLGFDRMDFASFLIMPFHSLCRLINLTADITLREFGAFLQAVQVWLSFFLNNEEDLGFYGAMDPEARDQRKTELRNCRRRDGNKCLVTGTANPVAAYVVPFVANATFENLMHVLRTSEWLGDLLISQTSDAVDENFGNSIRCSDKSWNMLSIEHEIHEHWRKARCGFKCLEIVQVSDITSKLILEFRWLPINRLALDERVVFSIQEILYMFDPATAPSEPYTPRDPSPMPIPSGRIVSVMVDTSDAARMKLAIDVQWAIVRVAALSGAAHDPDFDPDFVGLPPPLDSPGFDQVQANDEAAEIEADIRLFGLP